MKNKTIITVVLIVVGLFGLMLWGRAVQKSVSGNTGEVFADVKSALTVSETLYDFGTISMANGNVNKIFKITNLTDKDINLKTVNTSCMCTSAYIENANGEKGPFGMPGMGFVPPADEVIKAGESIDIKVVYNPNAHGPAGVGSIDRFVYLTDVSGGTLQLEIKAVVTP